MSVFIIAPLFSDMEELTPMILKTTHVRDLRGAALGGRAWAKLRKNEGERPSWEKLSMAPLWHLPGFEGLRSRLARGLPEGIVEKADVGGDDGSGSSLPVERATLLHGDVKKECLWGTLPAVLAVKRVHLLYVELGDAQPLPAAVLRTLQQPDRPSLIVYSDPRTLRQSLEDLQRAAADYIRTAATIHLFLTGDHLTVGRPGGAFNVERAALLAGARGIGQHYTYAVSQKGWTPAVIDYLQGLLMESYNRDESLGENPKIMRHMVYVPTRGTRKENDSLEITGVLNAVMDNWQVSVATPALTNDPAELAELLGSAFEVGLTEKWKTEIESELLHDGEPVTAWKTRKDSWNALKRSREELRRKLREGKRAPRPEGKTVVEPEPEPRSDSSSGGAEGTEESESSGTSEPGSPPPDERAPRMELVKAPGPRAKPKAPPTAEASRKAEKTAAQRAREEEEAAEREAIQERNKRRREQAFPDVRPTHARKSPKAPGLPKPKAGEKLVPFPPRS